MNIELNDITEEQADKAFYEINRHHAFDMLEEHFSQTGGEPILHALAHWVTCGQAEKIRALNSLVDVIREGIDKDLRKHALLSIQSEADNHYQEILEGRE